MTLVHPALRDTDWLDGIPSRTTLLDRASLVGVTASLAARPLLWQPLVRHDPNRRWNDLLLRIHAYSPPDRPMRRYVQSTHGWLLEPEVVRS